MAPEPQKPPTPTPNPAPVSLPLVSDPEAVRRTFEAFAKAVQKPVHDTSGDPANITENAMRLENETNQKNVDRKLAEALGYIKQQGFRSRMVRAGFNYFVTIWHHSEGTGHGNENPPERLAGKAADGMAAAVTKENDALKLRVSKLEHDLAAEKARSRGHDGKDADGVTTEGMTVVVG